MCGIIGYIGKKHNGVDVIIDGLKIQIQNIKVLPEDRH